MPLLTLRDVVAGFGGPPLLDGVSVAIDDGERVALVGRNGMGKTTLLRLIAGDMQHDSGEIQRLPDLRVASLVQIVPPEMSGTVFENVALGLDGIGERVSTHHRLTVAGDLDEIEAIELEAAEQSIQAADAWPLFQKVEAVISRLDLPADERVGPLSAGLRRRVLLGRALVRDPQLLILDEPTNHLDVDSIEWLEGFLNAFTGAVLFVTHDRFFLERVARRILDLDRGRLASYDCSWAKYLERKQEELDVEAEQNKLFDKRLAEEEKWIRKGVKERRKRNMGRVRELIEMRRERQERRERLGSVQMVAQEAERSGRLVIEAKNIDFSYEEPPREIVSEFSTTIQRGDRIGIVGANGTGKTTLIRLLLGELEPLDGSVRHGTHLEISYFDQLHASLDDEKKVQENISTDSDMVRVGDRSRHIVGYLGDFLFTPLQIRGPVKNLSGGERNRLLLARVFARPSNVLVLDEPTNDLDIETLELLEEMLLNYTGTVLVVSHDRAFLDNVVTSVFAFDSDGRVREYVGGFSDWLRQRPGGEAEQELAKQVAKKSAPKKRGEPVEPDAPRKLTYLEQKELEKLPARLEELEEAKQELLTEMEKPEFYERERTEVDAASRKLSELDEELTATYARWEELEARA